MKQETKEKLEKILGDVKGGLVSGFNASKKGLQKAGVAAKHLGDVGVVSVEKKQFESKRKKLYELLGELASKKLSGKKAAPLTADDEDASVLLQKIVQLTREINKREKLLKELEDKPKSAVKKTSGKKPSQK